MINHQQIATNLLGLAGVERFEPIADAKEAMSIPRLRMVIAARPVDDMTLAILAHEAGHVATSQELKEQGYSLLSIEYCATRWAERTLKALKVKLTPTIWATWYRGLASYVAPDTVAEARADGTADLIRDWFNKAEQAEKETNV